MNKTSIYKNESENNQVNGTKIYYSHSLRGSDTSNSRITWYVSGYSERAFFYPITSDVLRVNNSPLEARYLGVGNADKIILNTLITFKGTSVALGYPPSVTVSGRTISWRSAAVPRVSVVTTRSLWAEGKSRTLLFGADLRADAEIYKGTRIYRPDAYKYQRFFSK